MQVVDVPLALDCAFHDGICGKMTRSAMLSLKVLKKLVFKTETEVFKVEDSSLNTIMRADFKLNRHVATSIKEGAHSYLVKSHDFNSFARFWNLRAFRMAGKSSGKERNFYELHQEHLILYTKNTTQKADKDIEAIPKIKSCKNHLSLGKNDFQYGKNTSN